MFFELFLLLLTFLGIYAYKKKVKMDTYWQSQGVKVPKYWPLIGNSIQMHPENMMKRKNVNQILIEQYHEMEGEPFYGTYFGGSPAVVIKDPDLMKQMLIKDFSMLMDRIGDGTKGMFEAASGWTDQVWRKQMAMADAKDWKDIRATFSPIFTSGKMKAMVPFIEKVRTKLVDTFQGFAEGGEEFELREQMGKFSMDSIASCAFGVEAKSFDEEDGPFVKNAKSIFQQSLSDVPAFLLMVIPGGKYIIDYFKLSVFKPKATKFIVDVVRQTLKERSHGDYRRNDLIDMMIDAMKDVGNEIPSEEAEDQYEKDAAFHHKPKKEFDEIALVATAMIILVAGYDTTSLTMSYLCFELARNKEIQERLQREIDQTIENNNGQLPDYYGIQSLEYLDMVFHETLRRYPPTGPLVRATIEDYKIPDSNVVIEKGKELFFNVVGMHSDPQYYPDPDKFNPEHFSKESKSNRNPYAFAPFGHGPRNCIGMRFAMLEAKMGIVALMAKYEFYSSAKTVMDKIVLDPVSQMGAPLGGLWIKVKQRT